MFSNKVLFCALAVSLWGASTAHADDLIIDLKAGKITQLNSSGGGTNHNTTFSPTAGFPWAKATLNAGSIAPWEALVELNLTPGPINGNPMPARKRVNILVEYDGNPRGWTVHVGDDQINDGYGGGGSEFQVLTQVTGNTDFENTMFAMYSTIFGGVDKLVDKRVSVKDGSLRFSVSNQEVTMGSPYEVFQAGTAKNLFALPNSSGDNRLWAAFNRVISGRPDRKGLGVSKVIISTEN